MQYDRKIVRVESLAVRRAYELQLQLGFYDNSYLSRYYLFHERGYAAVCANRGLELFDNEGHKVGFEEVMHPSQFALEYEIEGFMVCHQERASDDPPYPDSPNFIERKYSFEFRSDNHEVIMCVNVCYAMQTKNSTLRLLWETAFKAHPFGSQKYSSGDCILERGYKEVETA